MKKNGFFVISLDFELLWGVFDEVDYKQKRKYFRNTRKVIPEILQEFKKYDVHATWASVGMLFNSDWKEWKENIPSVLPAYKNSSLSAYRLGEKIENDDTEELCFAPELLKKIASSPSQEIATHTYSHYYCMEEGADTSSFEADLDQALAHAGKMGIKLKSLVFPRNQLVPGLLKICKEKGIQNVRSNPSEWYWKDPTSNNILDKVGRSGDAYLNFGKKSYPLDNLRQNSGLPLEQKSSRFLRPVEENDLLRKLKLKRIKKEMDLAAKKNEIYHLWWHPHNFGEHPEKSLQDLKEILYHFDRLRNKYHFSSKNMAEIGELVS